MHIKFLVSLLRDRREFKMNKQADSKLQTNQLGYIALNV